MRTGQECKRGLIANIINNNVTMSQFNTKTYFVISILLLSAFSMGQSNVFAQVGPTAPNLGAASNFGILAGTTYTDGTPTSISGDLGYTTLIGTPIVSGTTHHSDTAYSNAISALNSAITSANGQACTANFTTTNLSTDGAGGGIG